MSFLENTILEKHYLLGEKLFDQGGVLEVIEVEKNLWSVMIRDEGIIEVEIQSPNTKRQKSTCECDTFHAEKSCAHIAAALLHLRKQNRDRERSKKEKLPISQTFNLKTILANIETEDLIRFVKSYAQTDKMFGILLKASFARKIDLNDNSQKYESIISTLIRPISTESRTSSKSDLRIALKVIDEFNTQLEDAISLNQLEEAFIIIKTCLPKLHYVYSNYHVTTEKVVNLIRKFHVQIDFLYDNQLAPALLSKLDVFLENLYQKSYYNHLIKINDLFHIAEKQGRSELLNRLNLIIKSKNYRNLKPTDLVVFTALQIQLNHYEDIKSNDDISISAIHLLIEKGFGRQALNYMETLYDSNVKNKKLEFALVASYQALGEIQKFQNLAAALYVSNTDNRYYRMLKENASDANWRSIRDIIIHNIKTQEPGPNFVARFYEKEGMNEELLILLNKYNDLRMIMKYDFNLYRKDYIALEKLYHQSMKVYLENHAGHIATRFIEEVFYHLAQIKAHKLITSIKSYIAIHFPHRSILTSFT